MASRFEDVWYLKCWHLKRHLALFRRQTVNSKTMSQWVMQNHGTCSQWANPCWTAQTSSGWHGMWDERPAPLPRGSNMQQDAKWVRESALQRDFSPWTAPKKSNRATLKRARLYQVSKEARIRPSCPLIWSAHGHFRIPKPSTIVKIWRVRWIHWSCAGASSISWRVADSPGLHLRRSLGQQSSIARNRSLRT